LFQRRLRRAFLRVELLTVVACRTPQNLRRPAMWVLRNQVASCLLTSMPAARLQPTLRIWLTISQGQGDNRLVNTAVTASKRRKRKRIIAKRCAYYLMARMIS